MIFVLDTNTCIYFLNRSFPSIAEEMVRHTAEELSVTTITVAELYYGAHHSKNRTRNLAVLDTFLTDLQVFPFDRPAAENYGELKERLRTEGTPLGHFDLLIASLVRSRRYTLVTHDFKAFSQVSDLLVVDWVR